MVSANVKIIEELKAFLESVANEPALRKLFTQSEVDFTRNRKLTLERVIGIIINMPKRSLSIELQDFFHSIDADLEPSTKGAFSLQRGKLLFSIIQRYKMKSNHNSTNGRMNKLMLLQRLFCH